MTLYNVHLYREMKLLYSGIDATSHEEAAQIARDRDTDEADSLDDCDGETFAALVDVAGDESFKHSRTIDFDAERQRKAAAAMLDALHETLCEIEYWHRDMLTPEERAHPRGSGWERVYDKCRAAIAQAEAA